MDLCWNCKVSPYHKYEEDKGLLRCPRCGELEKDKPAQAGKTPAAPRRAAPRKKES